MKVYLLKDVEKVGMAGEIIKVSDGYASNYLLPKKVAIQITPENEALYTAKRLHVEKREQTILTKTSMLAERIKSMDITIARKMHEGQLYGSINAQEIVDALAAKGISIAKNQVDFEKSIKSKGVFEVTIKLSSKLQPRLKVKVVALE